MFCSWREYGKQKLLSGAMTILTAGIAQYYTWSTAVAKTAYSTFKARCGISMLLAAGRKMVGKIGKAVRSALISMGIQKVLSYIKQLIVDKILEFLKKHIATVCAVGSTALAALVNTYNPLLGTLLSGATATTVSGIQRMTSAMSAVWKGTGGNVEESKRLIRETVQVDAASREMHST